MTLSPEQQETFFTLGLLVLALLAFFLPRWLRRRRGAAAVQRLSTDGESTGLPEPWRALRAEVERGGSCLTASVFAIACQLFQDHYADGQQTPASLTNEYGKEEFLLVVDENGQLCSLPPGEVDTFRRIAAGQPDFARWFRETAHVAGETSGQPVLLAARWLCHLAGLRHGTVEVFIDPPDLPGFTLAQVRGMDKFEAPGAFDIPCAGHVSGLDSPEAALEKELGEELNLRLEDLADLRQIGRYNSYTGGGSARKINHEYRVLYRAWIRSEAVARIRFTDGEVAALAVFAVSELRELVRKYPERVASGLSDAMRFYEP